MGKKPRIHNEWFRPVQRGNRKSCPNCHAKLEPGEQVWYWGEYVNAKWRNVQDICKNCWPGIVPKLLEHERQCPDNCTITLVGYGGYGLPSWLKLPERTLCQTS